MTDFAPRSEWTDDQLGKVLQSRPSGPDGRRSRLLRARVLSRCSAQTAASPSFDLALWTPTSNTTESDSGSINEGAILSGFVVNSSGKGVFVRVDRSQSARVFPRNLADEFVQDVAKEFPRGRLVAGRVLSVTASKPSKNKPANRQAGLRVEMTLKPSQVSLC